MICFDKSKCHQKLRADIKRFIKLMKHTHKWEFDDLSTCLFEENPSIKLESKDIRPFAKRESFYNSGGRTHGHVLMEYNGNSRRGTKCKVVKRLAAWLLEKGWSLYWSTVFDDSQARPLYHSRERQEGYLMSCQYQFFL